MWGVGFYPFLGSQLPNFQGKSPPNFPPAHSQARHCLISKRPKDIIQLPMTDD
ncbi:unknown protein [Microcystis aeruginosa NIES-843]|uniref:Uncharacterized protein n=2 Tax=Microcystis aeruginosa TaxID=1126 RepID=B0JT80_MICAN|nr:unknown protein [Microcystis aeruginosa NIES-843]